MIVLLQYVYRSFVLFHKYLIAKHYVSIVLALFLVPIMLKIMLEQSAGDIGISTYQYLIPNRYHKIRADILILVLVPVHH